MDVWCGHTQRDKTRMRGGEVEIIWICEKEMCRCPNDEVWEVGYGGNKEKSR